MSKANPEKKVSTPKVQATSLADIKATIKKRTEGEDVALPSGLVFKLKKPSISKLMQQDVFPSELVTAAINMDSNNIQPKTKQEYLQSLKVMDIVVEHAVVFPKVVLKEEDVSEESIHISDVDDMDRVAIYLYAQTGAKPELKSFRGNEADSNSGPTVPPVPGS